jgi:hypothetical protein
MAKLAEKFAEISKTIKNQPKDIWFFYLFLLTFTLGVRKVVLYFPVKRTFNEYSGVYVYASDIFLYFTILAWITSILYNKISILSSSNKNVSRFIHRIKDAEGVNDLATQKLSTGEKYFIKAMIAYFRAILLGLIIISLFDHYLWDIWQGQVSFWLVCGILVSVGFTDCSTWNNLKLTEVKKCSTPARRSLGVGGWNIFKQFSIFLIPLTLVIWSFISIAWSENQLISFYRSVRFTELYLLFIYVVVRFVPCLTQSHLNCSTWNNSTVCNSSIVPRGTFNGASMFFWVIIFVGVVQSLIGITQFILQHSIGLFWFKESLISSSIAGVAKIIVNSEPLIRAYGLFPHPNILGGFLFFSIIITLLYKKLFHPEESKIVPRGTILDHGAGVEQFAEQKNVNCSTLLRQGSGGQAWNNFEYNDAKNVPRGTIWILQRVKMLNWGNIINLILLIQIFGILFSFSKSAILALVVALIYINVPRGTFSSQRGTTENNGLDSKKSDEGDFVNCSTLKNPKLFHVEQFGITRQAWNNRGDNILKMFHVEHSGAGMSKLALFTGFLLLMFVGLVYFKFDFQAFFVKSLGERNLYLTISERIISENPIVGVGTGQFIFGAEKLFPNLEIWQYQPVHNVFLLNWSEWGIVGLVLFILFLWKLFHLNVPRGTIRRK